MCLCLVGLPAEPRRAPRLGEGSSRCQEQQVEVKWYGYKWEATDSSGYDTGVVGGGPLAQQVHEG
jgi:hypothetical protein